jgi:hypothetical protein
VLYSRTKKCEVIKMRIEMSKERNTVETKTPCLPACRTGKPNRQAWYEKAYNSIADFWNFFNGKKNKIGNAALAMYGVAETAVQLGIIPEYTLIGQTALYAGLVFKVLGLSHKAAKGELSLPEGLRKKTADSPD